MRPRRPGRMKPCLNCGKEFHCPACKEAGSPIGEKKYCSNGCSREHHRKQQPELFWARVDKTPHPKGCWIWTGYCQKFGHGSLGRGDGKGGLRTILAHRYAWELLHGSLPGDKCLLHHCDNPPCVNPEHLYLGDRQDNMRDKIARGRVIRGQDFASAKLTNEDVLEIRRLKGVERGKSLAARFGVRESHISNIWTRRLWKHLP